MSKSVRIQKVVIVGRDEALWLTANVLWSSFERTGMKLSVIELPSHHRAGDIIPTLRSQEAFHSLMGLKEAPLMAASQATFTLGQRFANFAKTRPPFMHAYGSTGRSIHRIKFLNYWLKARAMGLKAEYEDFCLNAVAARQGRFFVPTAETADFAECDYGYHFGAAAYVQTLKRVALQRGVMHTAARLAEIRRDAESGDITAISLSDGQVVEGDFFVDATGAESLLLGGVMGIGNESWEAWFPCNRLLTASAAPLSALPAYSQVSAFRSGWVGLFPLRDRTAVQQAYSSVDQTEAQALESAAMVASMPLSPEAFVTPYAAGRRTVAWAGNCVAIGEAGAVFDPVSGVGAQAILTALSHLTALFPADRHMQAERTEFNRNTASAFERIRDFQICHYKLNQRYGQPLWDHCRDAELPDALAYKLELFEARGHVVEYDDETFTESDWTSVLIGHGLMPRAWDPVVDQTPDGEVIQRFQQMLGFIKNRVEAMPPMAAYLSPGGVASVVQG